MLKIRTIILSVVLAVTLVLTAQLVTARTEGVSAPSADSTSAPNGQEQSANQNIAPVPSYRSRLDVCFDVPVSEVAACRIEGQTLISSYRSRLDECFDVPLSELASCRDGNAEPVPSYRSRLDECFDVPLSELAACRDTSQASTP